MDVTGILTSGDAGTARAFTFENVMDEDSCMVLLWKDIEDTEYIRFIYVNQAVTLDGQRGYWIFDNVALAVGWNAVTAAYNESTYETTFSNVTVDSTYKWGIVLD